MKKETLKERVEYIKKDMLDTADALDFISQKAYSIDGDNHRWMPELCFAMLKERVQHIRNRAGELFLELEIDEKPETING